MITRRFNLFMVILAIISFMSTESKSEGKVKYRYPKIWIKRKQVWGSSLPKASAHANTFCVFLVLAVGHSTPDPVKQKSESDLV